MRIYRIAKTRYINDLSGEGSRLYGGRWNRIGDPLLYFSQSLSLCLLEIIVHVDYEGLPLDYSYLEAEIPNGMLKIIQSTNFMDSNWSTETAVNQLQMFGSNWLKGNESLAMQVPSAVMNYENNFLINPLHKDFNQLEIIGSGRIDFDPRLFR